MSISEWTGNVMKDYCLDDEFISVHKVGLYNDVVNKNIVWYNSIEDAVIMYNRDVEIKKNVAYKPVPIFTGGYSVNLEEIIEKMSLLELRQ